MNRRAVTVDVNTRLWSDRIFGHATAQLLQDSAGRARLDGLALRTQPTKLPPQNAQFLNLTRHVADVLIDHSVHVAAVGARGTEMSDIVRRFRPPEGYFACAEQSMCDAVQGRRTADDIRVKLGFKDVHLDHDFEA